ncbi:MAG: Hsp20/alpha crystallin family protein [Chlorobi bacterium]|nr:Hsp20/alpha crystallin family protein [Chlorobiota bacterium]
MYFYANANGNHRSRGHDIFREIESISKEIAGKLKVYFENIDAPGAINHLQKQFRPAVDVTQDVSTIYVRAEVPGVSKEDISVIMKGNGKLEISGVKTNVTPESETALLKGGRRYGKFSHEIELPEGTEVDAQNITAEYTDGVLTITLPKSSKANGVTISVV